MDRGTAQRLLGQLDGVTINGQVDEAVLQAAALWAAWGSPDKARQLLSRLIDWNNTVWTQVRAAAVLRGFDPVAALRLVEEARATIPSAAAAQGIMSQLHRESQLTAVALELASYDLGRAAAVARQKNDISWSLPDDDRYTVLARIAHLNLDAGNAD